MKKTFMIMAGLSLFFIFGPFAWAQNYGGNGYQEDPVDRFNRQMRQLEIDRMRQRENALRQDPYRLQDPTNPYNPQNNNQPGYWYKDEYGFSRWRSLNSPF